MKKVLILAVLLTGCGGPKQLTVKIPTCGAQIIVPEGCQARPWGNGIEMDCPDGAKMYYCQTIKASPPPGTPPPVEEPRKKIEVPVGPTVKQ